MKRASLPYKLLSARDFGKQIGRSAEWVKIAVREGRIPAAQKVAGLGYVIPSDALVVDRTMYGIDPKLLTIFENDVVNYLSKVEGVPDEREYTEKGNPVGWQNRARGTVQPQNLRDERIARGLSQEQLADRAGLTRRTITNAERGGRVTIETLYRLTEGLGLEDYKPLIERRY